MTCQQDEGRRDPAQRDSVSWLATQVAHDFSNMLTAISWSAQLVLARSGCDDEDSRADLHLILEASRRGEAVTRQLLDLRHDRVPAEPPVRPAEVIEDMGSLLRRLLGPSIRLIAGPGVGCSTTMDRVQFERVIVNLAVNGRDAMGPGGTLAIGIRCGRLAGDEPLVGPSVPAGDYVAITVADTGTGMDRETRSRMFEPYFTTKGAGHGSGVELDIVREIVHGACGGLAVTSGPGYGTVMTVYLACREHGADDELS